METWLSSVPSTGIIPPPSHINLPRRQPVEAQALDDKDDGLHKNHNEEEEEVEGGIGAECFVERSVPANERARCEKQEEEDRHTEGCTTIRRAFRTNEVGL